MAEDATGSTPNMLWKYTEGMLLVVGGTKEPTEREFQEYYKFCEERWPPSSAYCMVVTGSAGLNPKQRDAINKLIKARKLAPKVAIVTDAAMVRGVVTALSWFNPGTKAFSTAKLDEALAHLDVPAGEKSTKIILEVRKMQTALAPIKLPKTGSI